MDISYKKGPKLPLKYYKWYKNTFYPPIWLNLLLPLLFWLFSALITNTPCPIKKNLLLFNMWCHLIGLILGPIVKEIFKKWSLSTLTIAIPPPLAHIPLFHFSLLPIRELVHAPKKIKGKDGIQVYKLSFSQLNQKFSYSSYSPHSVKRSNKSLQMIVNGKKCNDLWVSHAPCLLFLLQKALLNIVF